MPITSAIDLQLGHVPTDLEDRDPALYRALLDIHNAIDLLSQGAATGDVTANEYITRELTIHSVGASILLTGTARMYLISAATADVTVTLPPAVDWNGYCITLKCIDDTFRVYIDATGAELLDNTTDSVELTLNDSITVKSDGTKWWII